MDCIESLITNGGHSSKCTRMIAGILHAVRTPRDCVDHLDVVDGWSIGSNERALDARMGGQPSRFILPLAAATAFNLFPRFRFSIHPRRISTLIHVHALSAYSVILSFVALVETWLSRSCPCRPCDHVRGNCAVIISRVDGWMDEGDDNWDYYYVRIINFCLISCILCRIKWYKGIKSLIERIFRKIKISGFSRVP